MSGDGDGEGSDSSSIPDLSLSQGTFNQLLDAVGMGRCGTGNGAGNA